MCLNEPAARLQGTHDSIDGVGGSFVRTWEKVPVRVVGEGDALVPETSRHGLDVDTLEDELRGVRVTEGVEGDGLHDVVLLDDVAVAVWERELFALGKRLSPILKGLRHPKEAPGLRPDEAWKGANERSFL